MKIDAVGVAAIRLDQQRRLEALAAGSLKELQAPGFELLLDSPIDLALWKDDAGKFHGAVQNLKGPLPSALRSITNDWIILDLPTPPPKLRSSKVKIIRLFLSSPSIKESLFT